MWVQAGAPIWATLPLYRGYESVANLDKFSLNTTTFHLRIESVNVCQIHSRSALLFSNSLCISHRHYHLVSKRYLYCLVGPLFAGV